jgi:spore maturation protein CgeB
VHKMKIVIFGLAITSSWGNGHATLWRGLWRALAHRGHQLVFFEKDVPYYAAHRDLTSLPGGEIIVYPDWETVVLRARSELAHADIALVTSYCPDGVAASQRVLESSAAVKSFYDLDTPVTLDLVRTGTSVAYLPERGLADFDIVLSYTGGEALVALKSELGARKAVPLYGSVDPDTHHPVPPDPQYRSDLSYLGTYAEDRQEMLSRLFIEPARQLPAKRFLIGGAQYPDSFPWTENIFFVQHLPPCEHPSFFCSCAATLNVTRRAMAKMGFCPSGRLFEAAACGTPVITDSWEGLDQFFTPGIEVAVAESTEKIVELLGEYAELSSLGQRAKERTLHEHTAGCRALEFEQIVEAATSREAHAAVDRTSANAMLMHT